MQMSGPIPTESYLKVRYDLRPAKQVERRMIIESLRHLAYHGLDLSTYKYTGLGSIYFADFILFYKFLGIKTMQTAENSAKIKKRVKFNRPFGFIDVHDCSIGEVIPKLSDEDLHLLWLDYDSRLHSGIYDDVRSSASILSPGSILMVTVDVECLKIEVEDDMEELTDTRSLATRMRDYYAERIPELVLGTSPVADFAKSKLVRFNIDALRSAIGEGLNPRRLKFYPLYLFLYADGHEMLTVGGIIGAKNEKKAIVDSKVGDLKYIRTSWEDSPCWIQVPQITSKERYHLDAEMPWKDGWSPESFELEVDDLSAYKKIFPFFPPYAELLM